MITLPVDPEVRLSVNTNPYRYAWNDPINHSDPSGLSPSVGDCGISPWSLATVPLVAGATATCDDAVLNPEGTHTLGSSVSDQGLACVPSLATLPNAAAATCAVGMVLNGGVCGYNPGSGAGSNTQTPTQPQPTPQPTLPVPPAGKTGNASACPAPPGTLDTYGDLRARNAGFPQCEAHHIIQNAAVRDLPGYSYTGSPAIVLTWAQHQQATRSQNSATIGGTYGDEVQVAQRALLAAQQPGPIITAALVSADAYFTGLLRLDYDSPTRIPCSLPALRAVCG